MPAISEEKNTCGYQPYRAAALDIGSNSCRILIAESAVQKSSQTFLTDNDSTDNSNPPNCSETGACPADQKSAANQLPDSQKVELKPVYHDLKTTRLAAGIEKNGRLNTESLERTVAALKNFSSRLQEYQVSCYRMVGTSALREVSDADRLKAEIKAETGLELKIITGQREAELIYRGASAVLDSSCGGLVIDIGGGSTEIITKKSGRILPVSLRMGAVRFTERFITDPVRPIPGREITGIKEKALDLLRSSQQFFSLNKNESLNLPKPQNTLLKSGKFSENFNPGTALSELSCLSGERDNADREFGAAPQESGAVPDRSNNPPGESPAVSGAVGVGGTITSLAAVQQKMASYCPEIIEGYYLSLEEVNSLIELFASRSLQERQAVTGLQPARADIITAGTVILSVLLEYFQLSGIKVSEQGILYGILREELNL